MPLHTPARLRISLFAHQKAGLMLIAGVAFTLPASVCCSRNGKEWKSQVAYLYNIEGPNKGRTFHPWSQAMRCSSTHGMGRAGPNSMELSLQKVVTFCAGAVSKGDLRRFLHWAVEHLGYTALIEVEKAAPTAELEPIREGFAPQTDEQA
jgi:hypothetical protein